MGVKFGGKRVEPDPPKAEGAPLSPRLFPVKAHRLTLQLRAFLEIWFPFTIQQLRCFLFPGRESDQSSGHEVPSGSGAEAQT